MNLSQLPPPAPMQHVQIPPPIQDDGLPVEHVLKIPRPHTNGYAARAADPPPLPPQAVEPPAFDLNIRPIGQVRRRIRKVHRSVAPLIIVIGYVSSAAIGLGLGWAIITSAGWDDFARRVRELF